MSPKYALLLCFGAFINLDTVEDVLYNESIYLVIYLFGESH
jgi:hypothetical protein